jgi:hypothetical protein
MRSFKQNSGDEALGEVLFEIYAIGNAVKVSAVHVDTNTEVSVIGAPGMTEFTLKANALRKLRAVLAKGGRNPG